MNPDNEVTKMLHINKKCSSKQIHKQAVNANVQKKQTNKGANEYICKEQLKQNKQMQMNKCTNEYTTSDETIRGTNKHQINK